MSYQVLPLNLFLTTLHYYLPPGGWNLLKNSQHPGLIQDNSSWFKQAL